MKEIFGSETKAQILLYLGLRGGTPGRKLAQFLKKGPSQIFKALNQLEESGIVRKFGPPFFFALNPQYFYYDELVSMIDKLSRQKLSKIFMPRLKANRRIDPFAVYEFIQLRESPPIYIPKLSDVLREKYNNA